MTNIVKKLNANEIEQLLKHLHPDTQDLPTGMRARAKYEGVTISIYNSQKVMFQGKNAEALWRKLIDHSERKSPSRSRARKRNPLHRHSIFVTMHIVVSAVMRQ